MVSPICCSKAKTYTKYLLLISLGLCSLWLVWGLCLKFISGSTTMLREQKHKSYLHLPHFLLCNKERYNKEELVAMDLPPDFLTTCTQIKIGSPTRSRFLILMPLGREGLGQWLSLISIGSHMRVISYKVHISSLQLNKVFAGYNSSARLISVNTLYMGQCYLVM